MNNQMKELPLLTGPNLQGKTNLVLTLNDNSKRGRFNAVLLVKNQDTNPILQLVKKHKPTVEQATICIYELIEKELEEDKEPFRVTPLPPAVQLEVLVPALTDGNYLWLDTRVVDQMPGEPHPHIRVVL